MDLSNVGVFDHVLEKIFLTPSAAKILGKLYL